MGGMKTLVVGCLASVLLAPAAGAAIDLPRAFAECAGRFSASMEHAWLMQDPGADRFERDRAAFVDLLDAVGGASGRQALAQRIDAKAAQARLLQEASFGTDSERAAWALRRADEQLATCRLLLLGG